MEMITYIRSVLWRYWLGDRKAIGTVNNLAPAISEVLLHWKPLRNGALPENDLWKNCPVKQTAKSGKKIAYSLSLHLTTIFSRWTWVIDTRMSAFWILFFGGILVVVNVITNGECYFAGQRGSCVDNGRWQWQHCVCCDGLWSHPYRHGYRLLPACVNYAVFMQLQCLAVWTFRARCDLLDGCLVWDWKISLH